MMLLGIMKVEEIKEGITFIDDWKTVRKDKRNEWRRQAFDAAVSNGDDYIIYGIIL